MSEIRANTINNAAGNGPPNFPNGATSGGVAVATTTQVTAAAVPAGSVMTFAMNAAPTGWLKANGAAVSRTTYAALFTAIGTTFGSGDGSTTFNLPDLRGEFMRGWDDGRGVDSGRAFGSAQLDQMQKITGNHSLASTVGAVYANAAFAGAFSYGVQSYSTSPSGGSATSWRLTFDSALSPDARVSSTTSGETRARNIALLACIKF
jgi:microcystin-dependent protein